jgi:hypothetical protein
MSNHVIHGKSCHVMSFMPNHVIQAKSCHSSQIMSFMPNHVIHVAIHIIHDAIHVIQLIIHVYWSSKVAKETFLIKLGGGGVKK